MMVDKSFGCTIDMASQNVLAAAFACQLDELQRVAQTVAKLRCLFAGVGDKFPSGNVAVLQAWLAAPPRDGKDDGCPTLYADPSLVLGDAAFKEFRLRSCQAPLHFRTSMPGRVWRTGAVQIIQNVRIIPPQLHPRVILQDIDLDQVSEVVYMPVYDLTRPTRGPVAVLEVFLSATAPQTMLVADFISFVGGTLSLLQLSLSNPVPQPVRRSALCGRRTRAQQSTVDVPVTALTITSATASVPTSKAPPSSSIAATSSASHQTAFATATLAVEGSIISRPTTPPPGLSSGAGTTGSSGTSMGPLRAGDVTRGGKCEEWEKQEAQRPGGHPCKVRRLGSIPRNKSMVVVSMATAVGGNACCRERSGHGGSDERL